MTDKPKIVEAVGTAGGGSNDISAADVEKAMADAVAKCNAEGITDPDKIREAMMKARKGLFDAE